MSPMARPGDLVAAFCPEPDRCFRMVQSSQLQTTHCAEPAVWRGRFVDATGKVHRVEACERHGDGLAGVRRKTGR